MAQLGVIANISVSRSYQETLAPFVQAFPENDLHKWKLSKSKPERTTISGCTGSQSQRAKGGIVGIVEKLKQRRESAN
jgi:hypothetical protein